MFKVGDWVVCVNPTPGLVKGKLYRVRASRTVRQVVMLEGVGDIHWFAIRFKPTKTVFLKQYFGMNID